MLNQKLPKEAVLLGIQFLGKGEGTNLLGTHRAQYVTRILSLQYLSV